MAKLQLVVAIAASIAGHALVSNYVFTHAHTAKKLQCRTKYHLGDRCDALTAVQAVRYAQRGAVVYRYNQRIDQLIY